MYSDEQVLKKVSNVKQKQIIYIVMLVSALMLVGFCIGLYIYLDSRPLIDLPKVSFSTTDWTSDKVVVTVTDDEKKIESYSFDGGLTWQTDSSYVIVENKQISVQVEDIKGNLSRINTIQINNIDKEPPVMVFESVTIVQKGSKFTVRSGVQITDKESGLAGDYTVTPNRIDTSVEGEYHLVYSAIDKAGNSIERTRTIIVKDIVGRTYYRFRTSTVTTKQCNPYQCKCVSSTAAKQSGTCPTGYTINNEQKCCLTCYNTCREVTWTEWSQWQKERVTATSRIEVETMIKED